MRKKAATSPDDDPAHPLSTALFSCSKETLAANQPSGAFRTSNVLQVRLYAFWRETILGRAGPALVAARNVCKWGEEEIERNESQRVLMSSRGDRPEKPAVASPHREYQYRSCQLSRSVRTITPHGVSLLRPTCRTCAKHRQDVNRSELKHQPLMFRKCLIILYLSQTNLRCLRRVRCVCVRQLFVPRLSLFHEAPQLRQLVPRGLKVREIHLGVERHVTEHRDVPSGNRRGSRWADKDIDVRSVFEWNDAGPNRRRWGGIGETGCPLLSSDQQPPAPVRPVQLQQVDVVNSEALQRRLGSLSDVLRIHAKNHNEERIRE